jgi:hypothetical protein
VSSLKGITLQQGQVVTLDIDGTLVHVEEVAATYIAVVALPEQPTDRDASPVFTPGKVGSRKISPYVRPRKVFTLEELSERNQKFIGMYPELREKNGNTYIDRTDAELAAVTAAAAAPPTKSEARAAKKAERQAAKEAKRAKGDKSSAKKVTPRYLQKCQTCSQQPGHPDHGTGTPEELAEAGKHEFVPPADAPLDSDHVATVAKSAGIKTRAPRLPKAPKATYDTAVFKFIGNDDLLKVLRAGNPKYNEGNSGSTIVAFFREAGDSGATRDQVLSELSSHERWSNIPADRVEMAIKQLTAAGILEQVSA